MFRVSCLVLGRRSFLVYCRVWKRRFRSRSENFVFVCFLGEFIELSGSFSYENNRVDIIKGRKGIKRKLEKK